jgi:hypothetical protein
MKADIELYLTDPDVIIDKKQPSQLIIRAQLVEQRPSGPQRSGKYAHMTMTLEQAMRLLLTLQGVHAALKLPPLAVPPTMIDVPPAKDRN